MPLDFPITTHLPTPYSLLLTDSRENDIPDSASYANRCFMPSVELDENREHRIQTEIVVDAEDKEDRAMGWYYYLEETLNFPFMAKWIKKNRKSGSVEEKPVEVLGMAPDDECLKDMLVEVAYINGKDDDVYSAKLSEIVAIDTDSETIEAIADWLYWIGRGYKF